MLFVKLIYVVVVNQTKPKFDERKKITKKFDEKWEYKSVDFNSSFLFCNKTHYCWAIWKTNFLWKKSINQIDEIDIFNQEICIIFFLHYRDLWPLLKINRESTLGNSALTELLVKLVFIIGKSTQSKQDKKKRRRNCM